MLDTLEENDKAIPVANFLKTKPSLWTRTVSKLLINILLNLSTSDAATLVPPLVFTAHTLPFLNPELY
jgi:hypothetical protein